MLKTVEIEINDGIVVATVIPDGVQVVIKDYNIDGVDEDDLIMDDKGCRYSLWSSPG